MLRDTRTEHSILAPITVLKTTMSAATSNFEVVFCHNCDGGKQEGSAAASAIQSVFPNATVRQTRVNSYPCVVTIKSGSGSTVWTGAQRNLFRKYGHPALPEIKAALRRLR